MVAQPQNEPPGTLMWTVSAASFTVEDSTQTYATDGGSGSRYATGPAADTLTVLTTSLILPDGAVINRVVFEVYDNDADQDVEAQLMACGLNGSQPGGCIISWDMQTTGTPLWQWL